VGAGRRAFYEFRDGGDEDSDIEGEASWGLRGTDVDREPGRGVSTCDEGVVPGMIQQLQPSSPAEIGGCVMPPCGSLLFVRMSGGCV
jgi:hypothetical protein